MPYPNHLHKNRFLPGEVVAIPRQGRQIVEVILLKPELLHDIEADIHRIERLRKLDETPIITNEDDYYSISRDIDTAIDKVVERMQAYLFLPSPFVHRISTDHVNSWEEKSIFAALPPNWPSHCIDTLRDAVHTYVVKSAVFNLLTLSIPGDAYLPVCMEQRDRAYNDINAIINSRLGPQRIHPTFLG